MQIRGYSHQNSKRATFPKEECNNLELKIATKKKVCIIVYWEIFFELRAINVVRNNKVLILFVL